jgi:hypothetical protein
MQAYARAAVRTKYLPASNHRGSRVKATCQAGSVTIPFSHDTDITSAHFEAVKALLTRRGLDWGDRWAIGSVDDVGYIFTPVREPVNVISLEGPRNET